MCFNDQRERGGELAEDYIKQHKPESEHEHHTGMHTHVLADGTIIEHTHEHHVPVITDEKSKKNIINRLSRAAGHLESVKRMVENDRDCNEILTQLAAVRAEITNTAKVVMHNEISGKMVDAIEHGDMESLEKLQNAIEKFIK